MKALKHSKALLFFLSAYLILVFPTDAHAYLDPGTGSYILQMIGASIIAGMFAINIFWTKIKAFLHNMFPAKDKTGKDVNED